MYIILGILFKFINVYLTILEITIIVEALMSFIQVNKYYKLQNNIKVFNNHVLNPIRKIIDRVLGYGRIDYSPLIALLIISFIRNNII